MEGRVRGWFLLASRPDVVRRALWSAAGVGAILIAINHGDAIVRGEVSIGRLLRMALTVGVPYAVSTASSVSALRTQDRAARREQADAPLRQAGST